MVFKRARMGLLLLATAVALGTQSPAFAQQRLNALGQDGPMTPTANPIGRIVSPEIHPDGRVTFRLNAPNARQVRLTGMIIGPRAHWLSTEKFLPMNRDERGVWSITLGPLPPEFYDYGCQVDGLPVLDPGNPPGQVVIPGPGSEVYQVRKVPHGTVRLEIYETATFGGAPRYVWVYTPPGYDAGNQRYPVTYLLHGSQCCEHAWVQTNRINTVLDNLIADGKVKPMIVVMPLGARSGGSIHLGPAPGQLEGAPPPAGSAPDAPQSNYQPGNLFEQDLVTNMVPFIDRKFRTIANADNRALTGLSQGGLQTFVIGLRNTETFHWLAPQSAGAENAGDNQLYLPTRGVVENPEAMAKVKRDLKLMYVTVGDEDVLYEPSRRLVERLRQLGLPVTFTTQHMRHNYAAGRVALLEILPALFK